jgi:CheY-like chemotaxis protein
MLRCLIVDDSEQFLEAACRWLEGEGITVVGVASSLAQALHQTVRLQPDVVLVDIDLGGQSGFEVTRHLRQRSDIAPFHVILISAHAEEDYADLIAASPAVGFVGKTTLSGQRIRELVDLAGQPR